MTSSGLEPATFHGASTTYATACPNYNHIYDKYTTKEQIIFIQN
jgi:hypothetical protein